MKRYGKQHGQVLIILISSLFLGGLATSGGSSSQIGRLTTGVTLDTIQARIDEAIDDPQRKAEIFDLLDQWRKEAEAYFSRIDERRTKLLDTMMDHEVDFEEFGKFMAEMDEKNDASDEKIIDIRFALRDQMSRSEWEAVFIAE